MGDDQSSQRRTHFQHFSTTNKLADDLSEAEAQGLDVVVCQYMGGRDWVLVTSPGPIIGPAGRRVLHQNKTEE